MKTFKDINIGDTVYFAKANVPCIEERIIEKITDDWGTINYFMNEIENDQYSKWRICRVKTLDEYYYDGDLCRVCLDKESAVKYLDAELNRIVQHSINYVNGVINKAQKFRKEYSDILNYNELNKLIM